VANLRPLPLDGRSLEEALESKVAQFGLEQQLETTFKSSSNHESHPLTVEVENGLYRIAQEALSNAARHAQASRVEVTLDYDEDEVCLTIQDNGCGFELDAPSQQGLETSKTKSRNFGLSTMQERASLIGGWITIQSAPGQGCRVRVIVPYFKAPAILDKVTDLADQAQSQVGSYSKP
jgi:two-component system NarL family sensor kinase